MLTFFPDVPVVTEGYRLRWSKDMPPNAPKLTQLEKKFLLGVVEEKSYPQIAKDMGVSYETIKARANAVRAKLGVTTKVGLAVWAAENLLQKKE